MKEIGQYNTDLKLFAEPFKGYDYPRLRFLRWMAKHNLLEHGIAGEPSGELVEGMTSRYGREAVRALSKTEMRREQFIRRNGWGPHSQYDQQTK